VLFAAPAESLSAFAEPLSSAVGQTQNQEEQVIDLRGKFSQQGPAIGGLLRLPASASTSLQLPLLQGRDDKNDFNSGDNTSTLQIFRVVGSSTGRSVSSIAVPGVIVPDLIAANTEDQRHWHIAVGSSTLPEVSLYCLLKEECLKPHLVKKIKAPSGRIVKGVCSRAGFKGGFAVACGKRVGEAQFATVGPGKWQLSWAPLVSHETELQPTVTTDAPVADTQQTLSLITSIMIRLETKLDGIKQVLAEHSLRLDELTQGISTLRATASS
jgi:hypothetical protein